MVKFKNKQLVVTTPFDVNNQKIINLPNPANSSDAVNKNYVDTTSINQAQCTGLYSGGLITLSGTSHFNISSGVGYIVDNLTKAITEKTWSTKTYLPVMEFGDTIITISIGIDANGDVVQQTPLFTDAQRRQIIILGQIFIHPTLRTLVDVAYIPVFSRDLPTVVDTMVNANDKNISGNNITPNDANLLLNASSGKMLGYSINAKQDPLSPNVSIQIPITGITFYPTMYNGTEWVYTGNTNQVDPSRWSNGTLPLQFTSNNKFSIRTLFRSNGIGDVFFLCYPIQSGDFSSILDAENEILKMSVPQPPELFGITIPVCWIILKGNATNLSSSTECKIVPISIVSTASGAVATNAVDVLFENTATTGITSVNVQGTIEEVNAKIENLDFATSNQFMPANSGVSGNYLATNTAIANTPYSRVKVYVNGLEVEVGDGVKTKDCYFSLSGGAVAKAWTAIAAGDYLYWCGDNTPYQLDNTDIITYEYLTR